MKVVIPESLKCKNTCAAIEKVNFTSPLLARHTPSLILMTSLSSLPQLLAILDNLVEVSDLTDEERLWVYDKFASRTGKGSTRKETVPPAMNAFTFLMRPELEGAATRCHCARAVGEQQILGSRVQGRIPIPTWYRFQNIYHRLPSLLRSQYP